MKKQLALLGILTLSILPLSAFAGDITLKNNSNAPATAEAGDSQCSNAIGERGIIRPHAQVTVPGFLLDSYCSSGCVAQIFMSKNCTGRPIANVTLDSKNGVTNIDNADKSGKGYYLTGSGNSVSIEGGSAESHWYNVLFS